MSPALKAAALNVLVYRDYIIQKIQQRDLFGLLSPWPIFHAVLNFVYIAIQLVIIRLFKPTPPKSERLNKPSGRIAVIGAGLTGISSAAHCVSHNFEVVIYDEHDSVGGIWANVNKTSSLQLNSLLYRFHPGVLWSRGFPYRDEILSEIRRIWREYKLEPRTRLNTPVTSVRRVEGYSSPGAKWVVNDGADGEFDAVIVTIGTCGEPQMVGFPGMPGSLKNQEKKESSQHAEVHLTGPSVNGPSYSEVAKGSHTVDPHEPNAPSYAAVASGDEPATVPVQVPEVESHDDDDDTASTASTRKESHDTQTAKKEDDPVFHGAVLHSSELDDADLDGKTVLVIGSGASGVEAVETALSCGAKHAVIVSRDDKWIIPRNILLDTLISAQPFGREMPLSFLWEKLVVLLQYRGVEALIPEKGIYESTPVVNDDFLNHVRAKKCSYIHATTKRLTENGILLNRKETPDEDEEVKGDVVVLATGFKKPSVDFLPKDLFPENYERPNLYLQNFSTEDWGILCTNSAYLNAFGTHIGIYTRILLLLLLDQSARPEQKDMKLWVDAVRFMKRGARGGALGFFTYMELVVWVVMFHVFRLDRIRWILFTMQGWGVGIKK
ncbi:FAD/NAD-P-binding domain-containing protein [Gloeopeniophorella convolvens]|nr:FAD/NAD-P-binding domain-containing protein [Gloeopeniophorella convolvens]